MEDPIRRFAPAIPGGVLPAWLPAAMLMWLSLSCIPEAWAKQQFFAAPSIPRAPASVRGNGRLQRRRQSGPCYQQYPWQHRKHFAQQRRWYFQAHVIIQLDPNPKPLW